ncbi:MAG TPA: HNH endonuclease [Kofleriaceae bacterium]|nr:HNH endonuclease [Kofleriaceae bacterium]
MQRESLSTMSDAEVVGRLRELLGKERWLTAAVLLHLGEVEARELHLRAACSSMHVYCTRVLGMSDDEAFKRIRAARAVRRYPAVEAAVAEGRLHLSGVVLLAPHLSVDNAEELVAEASGKSKAEIEILLARRAPREDAAERLERVAEQRELVQEPPDHANAFPARVAPLAPERFALQLTISEVTRQKLLRAQALLRHQVPSGDLAEVLDRALDALLDKVERTAFGKTSAPRNARTSRVKRYVPRDVRRAVVARDGERCSFVAEDGRRCEETGFLELDHLVPVAQDGEATVDNVRVLCRAHNQFEAKRILGPEAVEAGRAARETEADLVAGLKGLGVTASDARQAVASSRGPGTIEERMRDALAALHAIYSARRRGSRCSEQRRVRWGRATRLTDVSLGRKVKRAAEEDAAAEAGDGLGHHAAGRAEPVQERQEAVAQPAGGARVGLEERGEPSRASTAWPVGWRRIPAPTGPGSATRS